MIYYFEGKFVIAYVLICVFVLFLAIIKRQQQKASFAILCIILCVYFYFVIKITQFPILAGELYAEDLGGHYWRSINLVPFRGSLNLGSIQNIIMTMPLGFLIPLIRTKATSIKQIALVGICSGFILEALQLAQLLVNTFTFRVIDVNDVLFNFCGVLIGYFCLKVLRKIVLMINFSKKPEINSIGIVSYFELR